MSLRTEIEAILNMIEVAGNLRGPDEPDHSRGQGDGLLAAAAMLRATLKFHGQPPEVRKAEIGKAARLLLEGLP